MANGFNPLQSLLSGQQARTVFDQQAQQQQALQLQNQLAQGGGGLFDPAQQQLAAFSQDPAQAFFRLDKRRQKAFVDDAKAGLRLVNQGRIGDVIQLAQNRRQDLLNLDPNADTSDTDFVINAATQGMQSGDFSQLIGSLNQAASIELDGRPRETTTSEVKNIRELERLENRALKSGSEQDRLNAERFAISARLNPQAKADIKVNAQIRAANQKEIDKLKNQVRLGGVVEGTKAAAKQAIKLSGEAFNNLAKIRTNILNLDEGVRLIDEGASTGVIASKLPSFTRASQELDNLQGKLGLDVVGSSTFGALSESELAFALDTALPTNLEPQALKGWLLRKKDAQQKLSGYLNDVSTFLGTPGNTVAKWNQLQSERQVVEQTPQPLATQSPAGLGGLSPEDQAELDELERLEAAGQL